MYYILLTIAIAIAIVSIVFTIKTFITLRHNYPYNIYDGNIKTMILIVGIVVLSIMDVKFYYALFIVASVAWLIYYKYITKKNILEYDSEPLDLRKGDMLYRQKDFVNAVKHYIIAAENGNIQAMKRLDKCYTNGKGVEIDYAKAEYYENLVKYGKNKKN